MIYKQSAILRRQPMHFWGLTKPLLVILKAYPERFFGVFVPSVAQGEMRSRLRLTRQQDRDHLT
ncbi:hypothetical protein Q5E86_21495 [Providencia sp. CRE-138-0111]|uniref:Uncharacterized protein n=1 Tax=Providencia huashanensis TaxID=3037798 RepID=A0ABT9AW14_9GAMM|nr:MULTISPECIES: hypothetical protein [Providencia]MDO7829563.1 hypothetical protein [Providencia sp. CRE-138-0026]MDO7858865.1 hypothetical protein [Providencia sp. CRE-138-0111]